MRGSYAKSSSATSKSWMYAFLMASSVAFLIFAACASKWLKSLRSTAVMFRGSDISFVETVLEQLEWYDDNRHVNVDNGDDLELARDSVTQATSLVAVLALFSGIGRLNIWMGEAWKNELSVPGGAPALLRSTVMSSCAGKLRIGELTCGDGYIASYFIPDYLCGIGAARHLTTLKYDFRYCNEVTGFCNLLLAAKDTLTSLSIHLYPVWYWNHANDAENELLVMTFLEKVGRGLVACSSPEEINIELIVDFGGVHEEVELVEQPGGKTVLRELPENVACWNLATGMAALVPSANLRRVRIQLEGSEFSDVHRLEWGRLRQLCLTASRLERVQIELPQTFDQRCCLAYEMSHLSHALAPVYIPSNVEIPGLACRHWGCISRKMAVGWM
ncbi:hypothetical protein BDY19DRAFT_139537 [Irpex rosettiformis]|uniref:Uncharacterized protein n=1 Tax=Irpex rosettiformis TaxID=378272 RepID=A0ACB8U4N4_9APHY|nr:hypothetical protein BDY19DRAFT_139537 [Irpex rosettiformis]